MSYTYKVQYYVDPNWNAPPSQGVQNVAPGISVCDENIGYADDLFVISIMRNKEGEIESFLPAATCDLSRELFIETIAFLHHYLKMHT